MTAPGAFDPVAALDQLGAAWSPDFDAYASGELPAASVRCVLCGHAPCDCPPFGSPEYLALIDARQCDTCRQGVHCFHATRCACCCREPEAER